jgi:hypothetical protein
MGIKNIELGPISQHTVFDYILTYFVRFYQLPQDIVRDYQKCSQSQ